MGKKKAMRTRKIQILMSKSRFSFFHGVSMLNHYAVLSNFRVHTRIRHFSILFGMNMHSLKPADGSRIKKRRIARGYGGKGGGTGGRGTRGQKSRSGCSLRPGFEGGQMPLYRRLPKLKGIAGGMRRGKPTFLVVNLDDQERIFSPNEEVTLESLQSTGLLKRTGSKRKIPLKVLGRGSINKPLMVKAAAFSVSAKEAIESSGGEAITIVPMENSKSTDIELS